MEQVGQSWQNTFRICVCVNSTLEQSPSKSGDDAGSEESEDKVGRRYGNEESQSGTGICLVRNELASNMWFITPAGYKLLGYDSRTGSVERSTQYKQADTTFESKINIF